MGKLKTAEDVCVEYAIAVAEVREQAGIIRANPCTEESEGEFMVRIYLTE